MLLVRDRLDKQLKVPHVKLVAEAAANYHRIVEAASAVLAAQVDGDSGVPR
jgi:hypothetical protein